jgi:aldehyde dehydrogenase (NAD+)
MTEAAILAERRSYVAGRWVESDEVLIVENPADESVVAELAATPIAEVRRAITEARRSFDDGTWADLPPRDRAKALHALLDHVETLHQPLVASMVAEAGQPVLFAEMAQFAAGMMLARNTIDLYLSLPHEEANPVPADELLRGRVALSLRRHEPVGVVVAITPYNGAIIMAFQKLIAAMMAGNSVILRPSPLTPISSLAFGMAAEAAGLPAGVLSIVVESGAAGAELLTTDPAVVMVSFTGRRSADPGPGCAVRETRRSGARREIRADLYGRCPAQGGRRRRPGRCHDGRSGVCGGHQNARPAGSER